MCIYIRWQNSWHIKKKRKMTYAKNHYDDTLQASICQRHQLHHANAITCNMLATLSLFLFNSADASYAVEQLTNHFGIAFFT